MLLALAALLALDGIFATYFVGLPTFLLVAISFGASVLRRRSGQGVQAGNSEPNGRYSSRS